MQPIPLKPVGLCHLVPGLDGKVGRKLEDGPDPLVDKGMQCNWVEASLLEGNLADV